MSRTMIPILTCAFLATGQVAMAESVPSFLNFMVCGSRADVLATVHLRDSGDLQDLINAREGVQSFLFNAEAAIRDHLVRRDYFLAGLTCAWVDDFTDGLSAACPWDQNPQHDLLTPTLINLCKSLQISPKN